MIDIDPDGYTLTTNYNKDNVFVFVDGDVDDDYSDIEW